jgi:hypothetical protein
MSIVVYFVRFTPGTFGYTLVLFISISEVYMQDSPCVTLHMSATEQVKAKPGNGLPTLVH